MLKRRDHGVGEQDIGPRRAERAGIAQPVHLHRRQPILQPVAAVAFGVALQIDEYVEVEVGDALHGMGLGLPGEVDEMLAGAFETPAQLAAVVDPVGKQEELEARAIVRFEHLDHQVGGGVVLEVRRQVADAQTFTPFARPRPTRRAAPERRQFGAAQAGAVMFGTAAL